MSRLIVEFWVTALVVGGWVVLVSIGGGLIMQMAVMDDGKHKWKLHVDWGLDVDRGWVRPARVF